jgi:hypothetical protein
LHGIIDLRTGRQGRLQRVAHERAASERRSDGDARRHVKDHAAGDLAPPVVVTHQRR